MDVCSVVTWNIAAINNNPFEYWITHPDPEYNALMRAVQELIDRPGPRDILLGQIFNNSMISELLEDMRANNLDGVDKVETMWAEDYSKRRSIQDFLLDKSIGVKRLTSMPDRITNTIHNVDGTTDFRPSVISAFDGDMSSTEIWWTQWRDFIFKQEVNVLSQGKGDGLKVVCRLIEPILRSKYPAISAEEQAVSIPLQILCLALFDATLVHLLNSVAQKSWQRIKKTLSNGLVKEKCNRTISILADQYANSDVIFIQEAAGAFYLQLLIESVITRKFIVLKPSVLDGKRDQNSFILISREMFQDDAAEEVSEGILQFVGGNWVAPGDLIAVTARSKSGMDYLLASFHGDSNGLSTQPFVQALDRVARTRFPSHRVIVGLDANTVSRDEPLHFTVDSFFSLLQSLGMASCWENASDLSFTTTCNARTCLQAQVNKAVRFADRVRKGQKNLKDWIIFYPVHFGVAEAARDNTGNRLFIPDMVFPTISFPSDHAIVSASLVGKGLTESETDIEIENLADTRADSGEIEPTSPIGHQIDSALNEDTVHRRRWFRRQKQPRSKNAWQPNSASGSSTLYDYWQIAAKPEELQVESPVSSDNTMWSVHDHQQQNAFLIEQFRHMTLRPPDALDRVNGSLSAIKIRAESVWILFASNSLSLALSKPKILLTLAASTFCVFVWVCLGFYLASQAGYVNGSRFFRFTLLNECFTMKNDTDLTTIVTDFGLLDDGKPILEGLVWLSIHKQSLVVSLETAVSSNGWWFRAAQDALRFCPLRFKREHSAEGISWVETTDPVWRVSHGALEELNPPYDSVHEPENIAILDYSPQWEWFVGYFGCVIVLGAALLLLICLGSAKKSRHAVLAVACSFFILIILRTISFISSIGKERKADTTFFGLWLIYDVGNLFYWACAEWLFFPYEMDLLIFSTYLAFLEALDRSSIHVNGAEFPGNGSMKSPLQDHASRCL